MAPPRLHSLRGLNRAFTHHLPRTSTPLRQIHSSKAAPKPSTLLDSGSQHAAYIPRTAADLRAECKRRGLKTSGRKGELVERLASNDALHSRSFQSAANPASKRPILASSSLRTQTAYFNTTKPLEATGDNSTIDFAYLPRLFERPPPRQPWIKVPFLPDNFMPQRSPANEEIVESVIRPEIATVADHSTHLHAPSAMSEVVDNTSINIDPFELTKQVSDAAARSVTTAAQSMEEEIGALRSFWNDILDDLFGPRTKT